MLPMLRRHSAALSKLALVMESARNANEWESAAGAAHSLLLVLTESLLGAAAHDAGLNISLEEPVSYTKLLERGQRLQEAQHYHCQPLYPDDPSWDWRNTE